MAPEPLFDAGGLRASAEYAFVMSFRAADDGAHNPVVGSWSRLQNKACLAARSWLLGSTMTGPMGQAPISCLR